MKNSLRKTNLQHFEVLKETTIKQTILIHKNLINDEIRIRKFKRQVILVIFNALKFNQLYFNLYFELLLIHRRQNKFCCYRIAYILIAILLIFICFTAGFFFGATCHEYGGNYCYKAFYLHRIFIDDKIQQLF